MHQEVFLIKDEESKGKKITTASSALIVIIVRVIQVGKVSLMETNPDGEK